MLFDGEDFILQMHRVFTRIRSGASLEANSGGVRGSTDCSAAAVVRVADSWLDLFQMAANVGGWKTLRVSASIFISQPAVLQRPDG
jgi:hypothetical protein